MTLLDGKVALITGGSKGIGYGIASALLHQKMNVAIVSQSQESVDKAVMELSEIGTGEVMGIQADVRDIKSQEKAVDLVISKWGRLDLLVANAGVGYFGSIEDLSSDQWQHIMDVNLTGVFNSVKVCVPELKKTKGYIITIGSLAGINFFAGGSAYIASKFGLVGFTQAIMLDLRNAGVKVSTILPGAVDSGFHRKTPDDANNWRILPDDIGQVIVDLLKLNPRTLPSKIELRTSTPPENMTLRSDPQYSALI